MYKFLLLTFFSLLAGTTQSQIISQRISLSKDLELIKISEYVYIHISWYSDSLYGRFSSNGMICINQGEAFLFDTPMDNDLTKELVRWIQDSMKSQIIGFVPNHWHNDCLGGLGFLHSVGIKSYANEITRNIAKTKGLPIPNYGFTDSLVLALGNFNIICKYFGPAHTSDNIVVWLPDENILFAGCMIREIKSKTLGNMKEAIISEWPNTLLKILNSYPNSKIVIPGHGNFGGIELITHTLDLIKNN